MAKLTIMRGLPASGKSTKAQELLGHGNTVRINKDLLRTMLHFDKFTGTNEGKTRDAARVLATMFLSDGMNVIIDDTNLNPNTVQSWKDLAKNLDAKIEYFDMDTLPEECIRRDKMREKEVGKNVIEKMALQYRDYLKGQRVVICDLDGTLCDISQRLHLVKGDGEKNWHEFFKDIHNDTLRQDVKDKVLDLHLYGDCKVIFVSARPDKYREETIEWLDRYVGLTEYILIMRESHDKRPDTEVKSDIYDKYLKTLTIVKVFDDRPSVIRMWRAKGLEVEDVGKGIEF